ncbi:uncharacterized protein [Symphalangus syndactylus]|uniref:uncharacterized protein n=1 Tax=Symphalangus syndactylus TaxID=9590 RepID=UPI003007401A
MLIIIVASLGISTLAIFFWKTSLSSCAQALQREMAERKAACKQHRWEMMEKQGVPERHLSQEAAQGQPGLENPFWRADSGPHSVPIRNSRSVPPENTEKTKNIFANGSSGGRTDRHTSDSFSDMTHATPSTYSVPSPALKASMRRQTRPDDPGSPKSYGGNSAPYTHDRTTGAKTLSRNELGLPGEAKEPGSPECGEGGAESRMRVGGRHCADMQGSAAQHAL